MSYLIKEEDFNPKIKKVETVTLDSLIEDMTAMHIKHKTVLDSAIAFAGLSPRDDATALDIICDSVGTDEHGEVDDEAFIYASGVLMDFAMACGMSESATMDLFSEHDTIAIDQAQELGSLVNEHILDDMNVAQLATAYVHQDSIIDEFGTEEEIEDGVELDSIMLDWGFTQTSFKRTKKKSKGGHDLVVVPCHRTIDGESKKGKCRYPKSHLKGKYKKAKINMIGKTAQEKSEARKSKRRLLTRLSDMRRENQGKTSKDRRKSNMELTRDVSKKAKKLKESTGRKA